MCLRSGQAAAYIQIISQIRSFEVKMAPVDYTEYREVAVYQYRELPVDQE
jgi:hypothetical protein